MQPRILIFDSGVGGLSLMPALQQSLPEAAYIYASDNAAHPYGTKSAAFLVKRVAEVLQRLHRHYQPDIAIIACNTASTVALPELRAHLAFPVIGVVPAIKPAAAITRSGHIALLATPGTIARAYTQQLITTFAPHCNVLMLGSTELVALAESKLRQQSISNRQITDLLASLTTNPAFGKVDIAVLGCTHFPLLQPELALAVGRPLTWLDSSAAIARRTVEVCNTLTPMPNTAPYQSPIAVFTQETADVQALRPALAQRGIQTLVFLAADAGPPVKQAYRHA